MKESIFKFGPNRSLIGVFTEPDPKDAIQDSPTAVILNAGIVHRIGPFRLHVDVARRLASLGFRSFRLDFSGLGDSAMRAGKLSAHDRALLDINDSLDSLSEKTGIDRFVLIGLCSGAYNGHRASVKDERVVGAVFLDGIAFRTPGFYLRTYVLRLLRFRFWRNFFKRRLTNSNPGSVAPNKANSLAEKEFFGEGLSRDTTQREIETLLNRGVRMLFLYTDGYDDISSRRQFKEMYGFEPDNDRLQLEYYEKSEHTYRLTANRQIATNRVTSWFAENFGDLAKFPSQTASK